MEQSYNTVSPATGSCSRLAPRRSTACLSALNVGGGASTETFSCGKGSRGGSGSAVHPYPVCPCFCLQTQGLDGIIEYEGFKFDPSIGEPKEPAPETGQ